MAQMIPASARQQINQQVGQAVTNAAMNELSNVFASKFNRPVQNAPPRLPERPYNAMGRP